MEQIDEKKNSEELVGLINSGTKDIFNKREVASRLGEDVAKRIKEGTKEILDLAGIASHLGEDVANHMKDRLEEKKDEKRGN